MEKVNMFGVTNPCMMVNGLRIKLVAGDYMSGLMEDNTMESGSTIICMGKESTSGQMEGDTLEIT